MRKKVKKKQETKPARNRIVSALLILLLVALGLFTRSGAPSLPTFIKEYAGDALWAMVAYALMGFLVPRLSSNRVALAAVVFSFAIELSQLYQAVWLNQIRRTRIGGLILGFGFLWSDLVCYLVGIGFMFLIEQSFKGFIFSKRK